MQMRIVRYLVPTQARILFRHVMEGGYEVPTTNILLQSSLMLLTDLGSSGRLAALWSLWSLWSLREPIFRPRMTCMEGLWGVADALRGSRGAWGAGPLARPLPSLVVSVFRLVSQPRHCVAVRLFPGFPSPDYHAMRSCRNSLTRSCRNPELFFFDCMGSVDSMVSKVGQSGLSGPRLRSCEELSCVRRLSHRGIANIGVPHTRIIQFIFRNTRRSCILRDEVLVKHGRGGRSR